MKELLQEPERRIVERKGVQVEDVFWRKYLYYHRLLKKEDVKKLIEAEREKELLRQRIRYLED